jgi:hypothetical protein
MEDPEDIFRSVIQASYVAVLLLGLCAGYVLGVILG